MEKASKNKNQILKFAAKTGPKKNSNFVFRGKVQNAKFVLAE